MFLPSSDSRDLKALFNSIGIIKFTVDIPLIIFVL